MTRQRYPVSSSLHLRWHPLFSSCCSSSLSFSHPLLHIYSSYAFFLISFFVVFLPFLYCNLPLLPRLFSHHFLFTLFSSSLSLCIHLRLPQQHHHSKLFRLWEGLKTSWLREYTGEGKTIVKSWRKKIQAERKHGTHSGVEVSKHSNLCFICSPDRVDVEKNDLEKLKKVSNVHNLTGLIKLFFRFTNFPHLWLCHRFRHLFHQINIVMKNLCTSYTWLLEYI